nr:putative ribonuclease H-like domain-containing protein [Tanacetum cinerariifolium]
MKLMSILNDKSCSTAQANMAGANQHMTSTSKDMTDVVDVSDLKLVVEYTVSMLFVHKLIKDTELSVGFDETKCYIQELRKGKVLGTVMKQGFLSQKGCRVRRGVKEKQVSLADKLVEVNTHVNVGMGINFDTQTPNVVNAGLELFLTVSEAHGIHSSASANEENMNDVGTTVRPISAGNTPGNGVDVVVPVESVRVISERVANTAYGFFPGKRVAYSLLLNMLGTPGVNMDWDPNWINAMNDEMHALYENDTWCLTDLPTGRKLIGSKWVFRIRYKSDGETDRLVLTPLPENIMLAHKEPENDNFLFSKRNNGFNIAALSDSDWVKFPVTWRSVLGYCVFVNGCLVSWKSKKGLYGNISYIKKKGLGFSHS